jgi:hypothetical protein
MLRTFVLVTTAAVATAGLGAWVAPPLERQTCQASGALMRLSGLSEASGLAVSRTTPGRLWSHNDSGKPLIVALDAKGTVAGQVAVTGAHVEDWEAMASAPCGGGSCLYLGDIGDNDAKRAEITIYRVPEPSNATGSVQVNAVIRASYPDRAHDAETLLAAPDGSLYVVTKGETGHIGVYRVPVNATGGVARMEPIGAPLSKGAQSASDRITDGAISSDGQSVVLRTRDSLTFYRAADFLKGNFRATRRVDLRSLGEPQGEAVAFGSSNVLYVGGEGGGKSQPGTLAVLSCAK